MEEKIVSLSVPAETGYARSVRMLAANLAVVSGLGIDDVEDVRMAAEEGFVYSCATGPDRCDISFTLGQGEVAIDFGLGDAKDEQVEAAGFDIRESAKWLEAFYLEKWDQ